MKSDLLKAYLTYNDLVVYGENEDDNMPFMPFLLMDAMNLIFEKFIKPLPLRHREKMLRNQWVRSYNMFINQFFKAFTDEQICDICDIMDDFEAHIRNNIEYLRIGIMNIFMDEEIEVRTTISATMVCSILSQAACTIWTQLHLHKPNSYIRSVKLLTSQFLNEYSDKRVDRYKRGVNIRDYDNINDCIKSLISKIANFTKGLELK